MYDAQADCEDHIQGGTIFPHLDLIIWIRWFGWLPTSIIHGSVKSQLSL